MQISADDVFKSDTIELNGGKITRIIRTGSGDLSISYNGGGFKSFSVALSDIAGENLENLREKKDYIRQALVALVYTSPKKGVERYIREVADDENVWVRWDSINTLLALGDGTKETLKKTAGLFGDPSPDIREKVCLYYATHASSSQARAIFPLLWDANANVRLQALDSVSKMMNKKTSVRAAELMIADKDDSVRAKAVEILFYGDALKEERVGEILVNDESAKIRNAAALILLKKGTSKSVPQLVKALNDKDDTVRKNVKKALDRIRKKSDIPL